jgi:hypothetical protein
MPQILGVFTKNVYDAAQRVVIAVGSGERHDSEFHDAVADSISKSSITGFASNRSHIAVTDAIAASSLGASVSTTM